MDYDLIKTIESDDEVPNLEENTDEEDDFQPRKHKPNEEKDFDSDFEFCIEGPGQVENAWNDLRKYVKQTETTKLDDKINKLRKENALKKKNNSDNEDNSEEEIESDSEMDNEVDEIQISDDELKKDTFKTKEMKKKKKNDVIEEEKMEFEECTDDSDVVSSFHQMHLSRPLLKALNQMNFLHPTPIQAKTIPVALMGRDICGCAATGTGKTAAYMLPTLERLLYRPVEGRAITRVLVLVPTRELGVQVYQTTKQLSQFTNIETGLSVGGLDLKIQEAVLRKNPDIVIATPGRLIDHIRNSPSFSLKDIEILILDEADRILDENFSEQMKYLIKQCALTRSTILFSATMTEEVKVLAAVSLNKPVKIFVDSNQDVAFNLRQEFIRIRQQREGDREAILAALLCRIFHDHVIVFVQMKQQAHRLHILLGLLGLKIGELHGNLSQPHRLENLNKFKNEEIDILIATDVAARGLDISGVKTVINFNMPSTMEHYIHRVGRTARAGRGGVSISLAGENERSLVKDIIKQAKNPVKVRLIAPEIIEKYKMKLKSLESDVDKLLSEERVEREIAKLENSANRVKKLLTEENKDNRTWFQTMKERKMDEEKQKLAHKDKKLKRDQELQKSAIKNKKNKKNNTPKKNPADVQAEKQLSSMISSQIRARKKQLKPRKIRCVDNNEYETKPVKNTGSRKRSQSMFSEDLTNTSTKNVKRMRHEANSVQRQNIKNKKKFGNKKNIGGHKGKTGSLKKAFKKR